MTGVWKVWREEFLKALLRSISVWTVIAITLHSPAKVGETQEWEAQPSIAVHHTEASPAVLEQHHDSHSFHPPASCAHGPIPASSRWQQSMFHLPVSASNPVIKREQGLSNLTTQIGQNYVQYIPKLNRHFRVALLVLQQIFSTLTCINIIVVNVRTYFAFSAAVFCFALLFSLFF